MISLDEYGKNSTVDAWWQEIQHQDYLLGRVVADFGGYVKVATPEEHRAVIAGKLRHNQTSDLLPKVGDWVAIHPEKTGDASVQLVMPRISSVVRKANAARPEKQVLAANVDVALIVQSLNNDFNLARLDRYAIQLAESGIEAAFIFNKQDLLNKDQITKKLSHFTRDKLLTSATTGEGLDDIRQLVKGKTAVFIGSSGVGKSTLTNALLGEGRQKTAEVRSDDRGRHTTSHRELFLVPSGGVIIDTPGIRELQLWGEEGSLEAVFPDIVALAQNCRFNNCRHSPKEQGCAVQNALLKGKLSLQRFESYKKLRDELADNKYSS